LEATASLDFDFDLLVVTAWVLGWDFPLDATSTSELRVGFVEVLVSLTGGRSDSGTAFAGGCSLEAMDGGTSSLTAGGELFLPHLEGLSAQAST
jgi:hypothetical protein